MTFYIGLLTYIGGFFLSINMIPQIYKTYNTKSVGYITYLYLIFNILGLGFYSTYDLIQNLVKYILQHYSLFSYN